jgi:hypothetical protein
MDRIQWVDHRGVKILVLDFSNLKPGSDAKTLVQEAKAVIHGEPRESVRTLFDATNSHYDQDILETLKQFAASNKPYVKAAAAVGIKGLLGIGLTVVNRFSGRNLKPFSNREEAMDWLVQQD